MSPVSHVTSKAVKPLIGPEMVTRRMVVRSKDVVFVKGVIEATEGLAQVFAEGGGDLVIAAPKERAAELDEFLRTFAPEVGAILSE